MTGMTGGCLCGAIRYQTDIQPVMVAICHCTNCRKQSGSAFSVNAIVPEAAFHQSGETTIFADKGDSGKTVFRHFCNQCGSPITSRAEAMPDVAVIKAGTADDPGVLMPTGEYYCDSALPWAVPLPGVPRLAKT